MSFLPLFKNSNGSVSIVLRNGTVIPFPQGRHLTGDEDIIEALTRMAKTREAGVYIDPDEIEDDPVLQDPIERIRHKAVEDYKKSLLPKPDSFYDSATGAKFAKTVVNTQQSEVSSGGMKPVPVKESELTVVPGPSTTPPSVTEILASRKS